MARKKTAGLKPAAFKPKGRPAGGVTPWSGPEALQVDIEYVQLLIDLNQKPDPQWILDTLTKHIGSPSEMRSMDKLEEELDNAREEIEDLYDDDDVAEEKHELRGDIALAIQKIANDIDTQAPDGDTGFRKQLDDLEDRLSKLSARLEDKDDAGPFRYAKKASPQLDASKLSAKKKK